MSQASSKEGPQDDLARESRQWAFHFVTNNPTGLAMSAATIVVYQTDTGTFPEGLDVTATVVVGGSGGASISGTDVLATLHNFTSGHPYRAIAGATYGGNTEQIVQDFRCPY